MDGLAGALREWAEAGRQVARQIAQQELNAPRGNLVGLRAELMAMAAIVACSAFVTGKLLLAKWYGAATGQAVLAPEPPAEPVPEADMDPEDDLPALVADIE